jgi:hypothetical protein
MNAGACNRRRKGGICDSSLTYRIELSEADTLLSRNSEAFNLGNQITEPSLRCRRNSVATVARVGGSTDVRRNSDHC